MSYANRLVNFLSLFTALLFSSTVIELPAQSTEFIIKNDALEFIDVELSNGDLTLNLINTEFGDFFKLSLSGYHASSEIGLPELPQIHRLIEIPQSCNPRIEILSETSALTQIEGKKRQDQSQKRPRVHEKIQNFFLKS